MTVVWTLNTDSQSAGYTKRIHKRVIIAGQPGAQTNAGVGANAACVRYRWIVWIWLVRVRQEGAWRRQTTREGRHRPLIAVGISAGIDRRRNCTRHQMEVASLVDDNLRQFLRRWASRFGTSQ